MNKNITINIIGCGRLGQKLAQTFCDHATIVSLYARKTSGLENLAAACQAQRLTDDLCALLPADVTFITVTDDALPSVACRIAKESSVSEQQAFVHCSGALDSKVLNPLKQKGAGIASMHPFRAFTTQRNEQTLQGCYCFLEGDAEVLILLNTLLNTHGAIPLTISPQDKALCHLAAVIASNHLITLAALSSQLLANTSVSPEIITSAIVDIMGETITNLKAAPNLQKAITGPLIRGDLQTIEKHVSLLTAPEEKRLYLTLSLYLLNTIELPKEIKQSLVNFLHSAT